jgi:two-component system OmpR family response regulator
LLRGDPQETAKVARQDLAVPYTPRVLVVEDDDNVRFVTVAALRLGGFAVDEVATGRDALAEVSGSPPDLVVLDVMLPDLDGFEVCRRMRSDGVDTPVVFLTARDAQDDRLRGLTIGGDDYLTKPFSIEELVARVQVVLRRMGKVRRSATLAAGDIVIDDEAHIVTKAGVEIALSPTEYKLLRFLMRNAGRAMGRGQILDHVWDYEFAGDPAAVETYISYLRRKLEDKDAQLIRTVRGFGYLLQPQEAALLQR